MSRTNVKNNTLFDRLVNPSWGLIGAVVISLVLLAIVAAGLDGLWGTVLTDVSHRRMFIYPAMVVYILIVTGILTSYHDAEIASLRKISKLDDDSFDDRVDTSDAMVRRGTPIALAVGLALGVLIATPWQMDDDFRWIETYAALTSVIMFALLVWVAYMALMDTRLINGIERQPLDFDILYPRPFIAIGRQSLRVALAFVGGTTIAVLFTFSPEEGFGLDELLIYGTLILITLLIFFLPMTQTHRILRAAQIKELDTVNRRLADAYDALKGLTDEDREGILPFSYEVRLWKDYEDRLKSINTWPYELGMLRTLLLSVLVPIAASQLRWLVAQWMS